MSKLGKAATFVIAVTSLALFVFPVAAQINKINQGDCSQLGITCSGNETAPDLINRIHDIVNAFLVLVGIIAAIYLVMGGVRYIMSEGEEQQAAKAKMTMLYALIGIILIGLSAAIVNFVIYIVSGQGGS
ncbi:MAG: hypothetical protein A3E36_01090 [Candidatus Andersenbacteria bacterium RIFCSPHIGHO2_12_FULL_45_11b]|uniref:Uncharacterized protein n=1 Tax=Candidatus Andersenbacteria bacterium RIFCSPHIGHO2_12_FULL_45_11b TaxID=1797282 RepID=A0A1G1XB34_9BACT|nr:MAG: hypothetical protein A3E36_01090 [Candidatus Andersenbacteria bacterium RIFCSPHIGHO2_12_FULL_45_11b]